MTNLIHRKEKIIFTAIDVINESGVQSLSTKKIAQKQAIAESTIFKHFENKQSLLIAVLDFYSQYDHDIIQTIKLNNLKGIQAIKFYHDSYIRYYENYPAITSITQGIDEMRYIEGLSDRVKEIILQRRVCLNEIILEAQNLGEVSSQYQSQTFVDVIMGTLDGIIRRWRMADFSFSLNESTMKALGLILGNDISD